MKLLVTGGMGFIGSNFIRFFLKENNDAELINLDKLTYAGNPDNLKDVESNKRHTFVKGDICDRVLVEELAQDVDVIINFAAETHVDRSITDPGSFIQTDVYGTHVLLEAARKFNISKFIQISTDEVYGEAGNEPSRENSPLMPKSPYAASKAGADRLAYSYFQTYGMPVIISRCTNNFGPFQHVEKLIPLFITNAIQDKPLPVYGTGKNTRDWIYVEDHCRALKLLLEKGKHGEVYNIGSGHEKSVLDITGLILKQTENTEDLINHIDDRKGHVMRHAVDFSKIKEDIGWAPAYSFDEAMHRTIQWYIDNHWWWKKVRNQEFENYYSRQYGNGESHE